MNDLATRIARAVANFENEILPKARLVCRTDGDTEYLGQRLGDPRIRCHVSRRNARPGPSRERRSLAADRSHGIDVPRGWHHEG